MNRHTHLPVRSFICLLKSAPLTFYVTPTQTRDLELWSTSLERVVRIQSDHSTGCQSNRGKFLPLFHCQHGKKQANLDNPYSSFPQEQPPRSFRSTHGVYATTLHRFVKLNTLPFKPTVHSVEVVNSSTPSSARLPPSIQSHQPKS